MNTDIEQLLRESTDEVSMDRPFADVLERGNQLRWRRRANRGLAGVAAGVVVAAGAGVGWTALADRDQSGTLYGGPGGTSVETAQDWSGHRSKLSDAELAAVGLECRTGTDIAGGSTALPLEDMVPIAIERRGKSMMAQYATADANLTCILKRDGGGEFQAADVYELPYESPRLGDAAISEGRSGGGTWGPMTWVIGRVSDEVSRVTITVKGETYHGTVAAGYALFWLPDGLPWDDVYGTQKSGGGTMTAYDYQGIELGKDRVIDH